MAQPRRKISDMLGGTDEMIPEEEMVEGTSTLPVDQGSDMLGEEELGALAGGDMGGGEFNVDELEIDELQAALADPSTPPQEKEMIQAKLALAARRSLAGIGGAPQLPQF